MYILEASRTVFFLVIIPLFLMLSLITALVSVIRQTRLGKAQADRDEARRWARKLWRENEALDAELAKERDLCAELRQSWRQARGREETTSLLAARVFYDLGEVPDRD